MGFGTGGGGSEPTFFGPVAHDNDSSIGPGQDHDLKLTTNLHTKIHPR